MTSQFKNITLFRKVTVTFPPVNEIVTVTNETRKEQEVKKINKEEGESEINVRIDK